MMTLDHVGDREAMVYAQLGQQPLARTTETSLEPRLGTLSCLSARPPDLATATAAQPEVDWCACGRAIDCPISILNSKSQVHGGGAIPGFALWTIDRFVAVSSTLAVELP